MLDNGGEIETVEDGWEHLAARIQQGRGGIMVVSHVGNLEIAARLFRRKGIKMMLFAGERDPRELARQQVKDMTSEGLDVRVGRPGKSAPFAGLEALQFLEQGGFVATSGDLSWADPHRRISVRMFDREVHAAGHGALTGPLDEAAAFLLLSHSDRPRPIPVSACPNPAG